MALYRARDDATGAAELFSGRALDGTHRQQLGDAASKSDHANARKLEDARTALATTQANLRNEQDDLERQRSTLDTLLGRLQQQQAAVDQRVAEANAALEHARVIGALHTAGEPVMGPASLTAGQMVAWYEAQGYRPRLDVSVGELAQIFLQEGADENVRGDVPSRRPSSRRGASRRRPTTTTPDSAGATAHARHRVPHATATASTPDPAPARLRRRPTRGRPTSTTRRRRTGGAPTPTAAARYFDTYFAKGWAPTWSDMGHGNWATDPAYSGKVIFGLPLDGRVRAGSLTVAFVSPAAPR